MIATSVWAGADASRLGAKRGTLGGGLLDMGPVAWFAACSLLWIVALPCYLVARPKLIRRARVLAAHPQFTGAADAQTWSPQTHVGGHAFASSSSPAMPRPPYLPMQPIHGPGGPPPGYYPDPEGQGARWWDGVNWAPTNG